jgi:hypothetical protein
MKRKLYKLIVALAYWALARLARDGKPQWYPWAKCRIKLAEARDNLYWIKTVL